MTEPQQKFGTGRMFFHWSIVLFLLLQIPLAWYMTDMPDGSGKLETFNLHRSFGMLLFCLAVARLVWVLLSTRPPLPSDVPRWEKIAAKTGQAILYLLVVLMPISGWMMSSFAGAEIEIFGLFELPPLAAPDSERAESFEEMHEIQSWILLTVIALHVAAALHQHIVKRNNVLLAMLPFHKLRG